MTAKKTWDIESLRNLRAKGICQCSANEKQLGGYARAILEDDTATAEQHMAIRAYQKATLRKEVELLVRLAQATTEREIDAIVWR